MLKVKSWPKRELMNGSLTKDINQKIMSN